MTENQQRPRRRRKDARPDEIIAAAFLEFEEKGYGRSTLAGIASRAGISRTTIYLYFETKDAIFEAAVRSSIERTIDDVAEMVRVSGEDFRSLFARAIDVIYERLVEGKASTIFKVLVSEGQNLPELVAFYRTEILSKGEHVIQALIERGIAMEELSASCRSEDVRVFVAPAIFAALWLRVFNQVDHLDIDAFKQAHVNLVADALLSRK